MNNAKLIPTEIFLSEDNKINTVINHPNEFISGFQLIRKEGMFSHYCIANIFAFTI